MGTILRLDRERRKPALGPIAGPHPFERIAERVRVYRGHHAEAAARDAEDRCGHGSRRPKRGDRDLELSPKEFGVLEALLRADGAVLSVEALLESVWDANVDPFTNTVRMTMMKLRRKLGDPPVIDTVTGAGYRV